MDFKDYFQLGTVIRAHGVKGDIVVYLDVDEPTGYKKLQAVFLREGDALKEWKVKAIRVNNQLATVHLEGIEDRNTSELLIRKEVYLSNNVLPPLKESRFYFHEVIGFRLIDKKNGDLGPVINVYEMPQHPILAIEYENKEVLIPAVPDFILNVDREKKIIEMELPDGLLEVYTA